MTQKNTHPFYVFVWVTDGETDFKDKTPLELLGESIRRFGGTLGVTIVILEGSDQLSASYKNRLKDIGFEIIEYETEFKKIMARFPNIVKNRPRYIRNCFLRWVALHEIVSSRNNGQSWHIDSDVLFYTSLDEIAKDTSGKTFVLQGCPAFVSIANQTWFPRLLAELNKFNNDIPGFTRKAFAEQELVRKNDDKLCNNTAYNREREMHDQDVLEYLIGKELVPQSKASVIFDSKFFFVENPLSIPRWMAAQNNAFSDDITEKSDGTLWLGQKKIPFIHYQGRFCDFANKYLILVNLSCGIRALSLEKTILGFRPTEAIPKYSLGSKIIWKLGKYLGWRLSKAAVMEQLNTRKNRGQMPITTFLNIVKELKEQKMV